MTLYTNYLPVFDSTAIARRMGENEKDRESAKNGEKKLTN